MFKATLIQDKKYYALKRKSLFILLIFVALYFLPLPIENQHLWVKLAIYFPFVIIAIRSFKINKNIKLTLGNESIEMNENDIRINSKDKKDLSTYKLSDIENLVVKKADNVSTDVFDELGHELKGKPQKNYIIINKNTQNKRFDFIIDSHYMVNQFNKLIDIWKSKGFKVEVLAE